MRRPVPPSLWLSIAVLTVVAAMTLARGIAAVRGDLLGAGSERSLYQRFAGDPALEERLAAAAAALPAGVGVRVVVPRGTEEGWATYRALYHLPQQELLGVHELGDAPPPAGAWVVDVTGPAPRVTPPEPEAR